MAEAPRASAGGLFAAVRFAEPLESEFLRYFDQQGKVSRLQLWMILAVFMTAVLVFHRLLLQLPSEVLPLGRQLLVGVMVPVALRWLSTAWSPVQRWSAQLYILSVFIDVACLMTLRVACVRAGYDAVPLIAPVALLMSLIVVQVRFLLLAPMILLGLVGIVGVELWAFESNSNRLFQVAATCALILVALSPAYELERWTRLGWLRERRLNELAHTDALTGLPNRRHFDRQLRRLLRRAAREKRGVALMLLDLDHFKSFNDHYGHPAGDDCLAAVGRYLAGTVQRPADFVARLGGEEFAAVWFDVAPEEARRRGEALRAGIAGLGIAPAPGRGTAVTGSAGLVVRRPLAAQAAGDTFAGELLAQADLALYQAKRAGRDRLALFDHDAPVPEEALSSGRASRDAPDREPRSGESMRGLRRGPLGTLAFEEPLEQDFRDSLEQQGRSSRLQIMVGLLGVVVFILMFDRTLLKIPEPARLLGQLTLLFGLVPAAVAVILGSVVPRLHRGSPAIYIGAIGMIISAQMLERVLQLPQGYDVVPYLMPVAVLLSLSVVQIRFPLMAPAISLQLAGLIGVELWAFESTGYRLLEVGTSVVMVLVTVHFAYKLERSARIGWLRERRLQDLAMTDALSGLANRHHFDATLRNLLRRAMRESRGVALMLLDIDHFKAYNDHYGHPAGDDCLRAVGRWLGGRELREQDCAARIGGEEFAVIWFDATPDAAPRLAEELRAGVAALGLAAAPGRGAVVTASAGLAQLRAPSPQQSVEALAQALMQAADAALYQAKRSGRDRLALAASEPAIPAQVATAAGGPRTAAGIVRTR